MRDLMEKKLSLEKHYVTLQNNTNFKLENLVKHF